ncbi:hypothetical protein P7K49_006046 [Saguinus oedipus]|uniref:Uncharacterized protein n=1 Tax=Saguinus oedipus TaxID=9490 RepID=A0ABQ9W1T6_SAGOE|nr:hypothetical protein P7K49_006046 [Saguinus oedipus]
MASVRHHSCPQASRHKLREEVLQDEIQGGLTEEARAGGLGGCPCEPGSTMPNRDRPRERERVQKEGKALELTVNSFHFAPCESHSWPCPNHRQVWIR